MISLPLAPLWILEYLSSLIVLILTLLSLRLSRRLVDQDPENALWLFFNWLAIAFVIFSITHMISHSLHDLIAYWDLPNLALIQRVFGGFDTVIYVVIAAIILFFHRIQRLYRRMEADHHHLEETSHEILALNREMEALVMERTMSEMALGMAHGIRNPLHVIGGFSHRLLRKTDEDDPSRAWATAIAEEARRIEQMVERFETLALRKTSFFAQEDLNVIVRSTLELLLPELKAKNLSLVAELCPEPLVGRFNKHLLKVALAHLVRNAVEATPTGRDRAGAHRQGATICGVGPPGYGPGDAPGCGGEGLCAVLYHQDRRHRLGDGVRAPDRGRTPGGYHPGEQGGPGHHRDHPAAPPLHG